MRFLVCLVISMFFTPALAQQGGAFVDSVVEFEKQRWQLSLDYPDHSPKATEFNFQGTLQTVRSRELSSRQLSVRVVEPAAKKVVKVNQSYSVQNLVLLSRNREVKIGGKNFVRHTMIANDERAFLAVSDDPSPIVVGAAILAGGVLAICGTRVITDILTCTKSGSLEVSLGKEGFVCKVSACVK